MDTGCVKESAFDQKIVNMADEITRLRTRLDEANEELQRRDDLVAKWTEQLFQPTKTQPDRPTSRH
jgi:hypothetical protein